MTNGLTNYDYEVLLHEIGHALGLKHPFEIDRNNTMILNSHEDSTEFTAMSYDEILTTFDGMFRPLDLMTLTKLYGVNSTYKSGDEFLTKSYGTGHLHYTTGLTTHNNKSGWIERLNQKYSQLFRKKLAILSQSLISRENRIGNLFI